MTTPRKYLRGFTLAYHFSVIFLLSTLFLNLLMPRGALAAPNTWSATGVMATAREYHTATLMPDRKVLVAGGMGFLGYLSSAELYQVGNSLDFLGLLLLE